LEKPEKCGYNAVCGMKPTQANKHRPPERGNNENPKQARIGTDPAGKN